MPKSKMFIPKLLTSENANKQADYQLILWDLDHALKCCDWLLQKQEYLGLSLESRTILDSLVIRYRRCFKKGVRFSFSIKTIGSLSDEDVHTHQFFIDYADKHVAHSVNACEMYGTVIHIAIDENNSVTRGGLGGRGVSSDNMNLQDIEKLSYLIQKVIAHVKNLSAEAANFLKEEVDSMTDDELIELPEGFAPLQKAIDHKKKRNWPKG